MIDVAALIADLVAAGTSPDLVGRVAGALAERPTETVAVKDDAAEKRRAWDRERKRRAKEGGNSTGNSENSTGIPPASGGNKRNSTGTPSPRPSPSPDKEIPPTPPKENNLFPDPTPQPRSFGARGFEKFWAMFPNKVGKAAASKAFEKAIGKVDVETMLAALDRYVHKTDDRPWCNPATWLNQERWADQPAQVARGSPSKPLTGLAAVEEKLRREILDEGFNGAQSPDRQDDAGFPFLRLEHQR